VLAAGKIAQGSSRTLAQRPSARTAVAQAEASLCAARVFYYQALAEAWTADGDRRPPSPAAPAQRAGDALGSAVEFDEKAGHSVRR